MKAKMSKIFSLTLAIMLTLGAFTVFAANAPVISLDNAKSIALKEAGSGEVTKAKLDTEYGVSVYEITVVNSDTNYKYYINAASGEIMTFRTKTINPYKQSQKHNYLAAGAAITKEEAAQKALNLVGAGSVVLVEPESKKDGRTEYDVIIVNGGTVYEVELYGNGTLKKSERETINSTKPQAALFSGKAIGDAKAAEIALGQTGGGTVVKCELDYKKEGLRYEVKVINNSTEHKVKIFAETGEIYKHSIDYK